MKKLPAVLNTPARVVIQEWKSALDVVNDPIFLHDEQFRILRCNKAYQQRTGIPFHELVGQPYYEVFLENHEPLPSCLRMVENAVAAEEVLTGDAIYRSHVFSIRDEQGAYLHSVHILKTSPSASGLNPNLSNRSRSCAAGTVLHRAERGASLTSSMKLTNCWDRLDSRRVTRVQNPMTRRRNE